MSDLKLESEKIKMIRTKRKVSEATTNSEEGAISLLRKLLTSSSQDNGTRCIRLGTYILKFYCVLGMSLISRIMNEQKISRNFSLTHVDVFGWKYQQMVIKHNTPLIRVS